MNAYELLERVKTEFESNGFRFKAQGSNYYSEHEWKEGSRFIGIKPTWRHNGTEENVTVTITVLEIDKICETLTQTAHGCCPACHHRRSRSAL